MGMDTVDLIYNIEKQFAIAIPDSEAEQMNTVQEIYEAVLRHLAKGVDNNDVYKKVVQVISDQSGIDIKEIQPCHSITNDLGMD